MPYLLSLSAGLPLLIDGTLQGPLTNPLAMISVFAINAVWGLIVGVIANVLRRKG